MKNMKTTVAAVQTIDLLRSLDCQLSCQCGYLGEVFHVFL